LPARVALVGDAGDGFRFGSFGVGLSRCSATADDPASSTPRAIQGETSGHACAFTNCSILLDFSIRDLRSLQRTSPNHIAQHRLRLPAVVCPAGRWQHRRLRGRPCAPGLFVHPGVYPTAQRPPTIGPDRAGEVCAVGVLTVDGTTVHCVLNSVCTGIGCRVLQSSWFRCDPLGSLSISEETCWRAGLSRPSLGWRFRRI
jgi:hypothetical protein